jgi:uncharacterized repeat protein (TIGR01451 family)
MGKHRRLRSAGILACVVGSFLAMASAVGADDSLQVIDLSVVQSITPQQAKLGDQIQAHLQIANNGTVTASNVSLTEELNGLVITGITVPPESCTTDQRNVSCHVGPGETIAITLDLKVTATGILDVFTVTQSPAETEANPNDNTATSHVLATLDLGQSLPCCAPARPLLPPLTPGINVNGQPVSGTVLVDGTPLTVPGQIDIGSVVDATNGSIQLVNTKDNVLWAAGRFKLVQPSPTAPIDLVLVPKVSYSVCGKRKTAAAAAPRVLDLLWGFGKDKFGNGRGKFRTVGRYAAATVRGTDWFISERCDGTYMYVKSGVCDLYDVTKKKHFVIRAGGSYLARPPAKK